MSRDRILDAAVEVLVDKGYAGASTLKIQKRARVSRGRLLHHFASRDAIVVAVARHLVATWTAELAREPVARTAGAPAEPLERIDRAIDVPWETFHQPYFWAATELWIAAQHNDEIGVVLRPQERNLYQVFRDFIDATFGPVAVTSPHCRTVRELLCTSMRGVALTYAFDPSRSPYRRAGVALETGRAHFTGPGLARDRFAGEAGKRFPGPGDRFTAIVVRSVRTSNAAGGTGGEDLSWVTPLGTGEDYGRGHPTCGHKPVKADCFLGAGHSRSGAEKRESYALDGEV